MLFGYAYAARSNKSGLVFNDCGLIVSDPPPNPYAQEKDAKVSFQNSNLTLLRAQLAR